MGTNTEKMASLESLALAKYHHRPDVNPYLPNAYERIASRTTSIIASELFMQHLYNCSNCKYYVNPTLWGRCLYPHRPSKEASEAIVAKVLADVETTKPNEASSAKLPS